MSWHAPALQHLLDQRLQAARLELLEDQRIERARHGQGNDSIEFIRHLIEEKFAAAARSGLGAVEASLRTSATEYLVKHGCGASEIRATLDEVCLDIVDLKPEVCHTLPSDGYNPRTNAAIFFGLWMGTITFGKVSNGSSLGLFFLLALCGGGVAALIHVLTYRAGRIRCASIARDYPAQKCGDYLLALDEAVNQYEGTVNRIAEASAAA